MTRMNNKRISFKFNSFCHAHSSTIPDNRNTSASKIHGAFFFPFNKSIFSQCSTKMAIHQLLLRGQQAQRKKKWNLLILQILPDISLYTFNLQEMDSNDYYRLISPTPSLLSFSLFFSFLFLSVFHPL